MKRFILAALAILAVSAPLGAQTATTCLVSVRLPRDARLYVDDVFCPLPGEVRSFETPPLDAGKRYYYELRVEITVDAKPVRLSKRAIIEPGKRADVDFGTREDIIASAAPRPEPKKADDPPAGPAVLPQGLPPVAVLAKVEGDFLVLSRAVFEFRDKIEKRTREVGGKVEVYEVTVKECITKPVHEQVKLSGVTAIEAPGKPVAGAKLKELLAKETNAYLAEGEKVDPAYLRTVKDGTLILSVTREAPPVPMPPVPPQPPEEAPGAEPRVGGSPPLAVKAWYKDGFIVWKQIGVVHEKVEEKVTVKGPDGKDIVESVFKTVPVKKEFDSQVEAKTATLATVGGKPVTLAELEKRLEKPTPIIVSFEPIAPFHLQLYDPDTLTVTVPPQKPLPPGERPKASAHQPTRTHTS